MKLPPLALAVNPRTAPSPPRRCTSGFAVSSGIRHFSMSEFDPQRRDLLGALLGLAGAVALSNDATGQTDARTFSSRSATTGRGHLRPRGTIVLAIRTSGGWRRGHRLGDAFVLPHRPTRSRAGDSDGAPAASEVGSSQACSTRRCRWAPRQMGGGRLFAVFTRPDAGASGFGNTRHALRRAVVGGPSWIDTSRFEINATSDGPVAVAPTTSGSAAGHGAGPARWTDSSSKCMRRRDSSASSTGTRAPTAASDLGWCRRMEPVCRCGTPAPISDFTPYLRREAVDAWLR